MLFYFFCVSLRFIYKFQDHLKKGDRNDALEFFFFTLYILKNELEPTFLLNGWLERDVNLSWFCDNLILWCINKKGQKLRNMNSILSLKLNYVYYKQQGNLNTISSIVSASLAVDRVKRQLQLKGIIGTTAFRRQAYVPPKPIDWWYTESETENLENQASGRTK